jgi:arylsulfatase A-like enzyme
MYEESLRVPMIWNHPGSIRAGTVVDQMVSSYDFHPTVLDYVGVRAAADRRRVGRSYRGLLDNPSKQWRDRLFFEYAYVRGLRTRNLKYIERTEGYPSELFDIEADPAETRNLIDDAAYARQLAVLRAELRDYFRRAGAPPIDQWRSTTSQKLPEY